MAMVKFLKGTLANYQAIPANDISADSIYITTDEGGIYLGSKRLGDYILVDNIDALNSLEAKTDSGLYYAKQENVLARWNGSNWVQINAAGLTKVEYVGQGDYVAKVEVKTTNNGTERYLQVTRSNIANHTKIQDHEARISANESTLSALLGGDGTGSLADQIEAAVAPVREAAAAADAKAQGAVNVNTTQTNAINGLTTRIGDAETAIGTENTAREQAITDLIDGASSGYATLGDLEAKIKAADEKAQGAVNVNNTQNNNITNLTTRVGNAETAISTEVTDRQTAITNLIDGASDGYATLGDLEAKIKAADTKAQGAVNVNTTQASTLENHGGRISALETTVGVLSGEGEGSVKKQVADAVAGIVANADEDFDTLKEVADWILNDKTGAAALQTDVATLKNTVSGHGGRLDQAETDIGALETALAKEVSDREAAVSGLVNGASSGYATLKDLETKVKAAQNTATTNGTNITNLTKRVEKNETDISGLTTRMGAAETAITTEVSDRQAAISGLVDGEATYKTFKLVGNQLRSQAQAVSGIDGRVSANETALGQHDTRITANADAIAKEVSDREDAIDGLVNGEATYKTFKAVGDKLRNYETRITNNANNISDILAQLEWGTF